MLEAPTDEKFLMENDAQYNDMFIHNNVRYVMVPMLSLIHNPVTKTNLACTAHTFKCDQVVNILLKVELNV